MVPMSRQRWRRWAPLPGALLALTILWGCQKQPPRPFVRIVFLSNREAPKRQFDIFVMNPDGTHPMNLTAELQSVRAFSRPVLSPDNKKILFTADENGKLSLQILDIASRALTRLTEVGLETPQASFSPRGDKIVFVKKVFGRRQIHIIHSNGLDEQNLSNKSYDEFDPAFSPDGRRIVFVSKRDEGYLLFMMNADGTGRQQLTHTGKCRYPSFSPDGNEIVFAKEQGWYSHLFRMKTNGKNLQQITKGQSYNTKPFFHPDGRRIIFVSNVRGMKYRDICIINRDGSGFQNLTAELNYINQHPVITPDGQWIVFDSVKFNDGEIYRVSVEGKIRKNLSNHSGWDQLPSI